MTDQQPTTTHDHEPTDEVEAGHTYDGIREYDNPIPAWWKWIFIGSIVFAPFYLLWFHAPNQEREIEYQYQRASAENLRRKFGELGELTADQATIMRFIDDEEWLAVGRISFQTNCTSCHGSQGQGANGPNLRDDHYIHIRNVADIADVLQHGRKNGSMPAWETRLHPTELVLTAAYVASLRGEPVDGGVPPQGEIIPPWPGRE